MTFVIRRLGVLCVFVLVLAGCAGSERSAVAVGDFSISRGDLTDLVVALNPGGPDELPATLSAETFRGIANTWTRDAAIAQALTEQGVMITDDERTAANARIDEAIAAAQIGMLDPSSGGYQALQRNIWVEARGAELTDASAQRAQELLDGADVESRLGTVERETSLIVAH